MSETKSLINLNSIFATSLQSVIDSGTIEKNIKDSLEACLKKTIEEAMGWRSPFREALEAKFKDIFGFDQRELKLDDYRGLIMETVRSYTDAHLKKELSDRIVNDLAELTSVAPEEIKISELHEKFIKFVREEKEIHEDDDSLYEHYSFTVGEESDSFMEIKMKVKDDSTPISRISARDDSYRIGLHRKDSKNKELGEVYHVQILGERFKEQSSSKFNDWGRFLASMSLRRTKVIIDQTDF